MPLRKPPAPPGGKIPPSAGPSRVAGARPVTDTRIRIDLARSLTPGYNFLGAKYGPARRPAADRGRRWNARRGQTDRATPGHRVTRYPVTPGRARYERFGAPFVGLQRSSPAHSALLGGHPGRYHGAARGSAGQHSRTLSRSRGRGRGRGAGRRTSTGGMGRGRVQVAELGAGAADQSRSSTSQPAALRLRVSGTVPRSALHDPALGRKQPAFADARTQGADLTFYPHFDGRCRRRSGEDAGPGAGEGLGHERAPSAHRGQ